MRTRPPWWAVVSACAAIVCVAGGWTWAQAAQPAGYSALHDTISALARRGLPDRWIMTAGLTGLGVAHVVTALGLRTVRAAARIVLAGAGVATLLVVAFPQPHTGSSAAHVAAATTGFVLLVFLPVVAASRTAVVAALRPGIAAAVTAVSAGLLVWVGTGDLVGLSERVLVVQQALWPLVLVVSLRAAGRRPARGRLQESGHDRTP